MVPELRKRYYDAKMTPKHILQYVLQLFAIRRLKKTVLVCIAISCLWLLWNWIAKGEKVESAITCKSKIAQIVFPKTKEKENYLKNFQHDVITMENEYFYYVETMNRNCYTQVHVGPSDDGGWEICLDHQFDIRPPCLIYSFGIGDDFRFEKGIEELLKCEVHSFDPSMGVASHQYSENGYFHNIGIDSADTYAVNGQWKMRKLSTIMKMLGHEGRTIDYLKMDVEFSEWPALVEMIQSGVINNIRQMALEVHTPELDVYRRPDHKCTWSTPETISFQVRTLFDLQNAGFGLFYTRTNYRTPFLSPYSGKERYCCHDIHLVNTKHKDNQNRRLHD